ncbi:hypothetical protein PCI56_25580 [Plesiomonas shigelloides subsp. oncorhynchi]|nr:hypothetical protein [Plesiomonas shigelloides]
MNRQLLIAVLMLFSGSIATAHAETLSRQYDQAVATSTEALEQAADTTKEWAGKTSEQLELPQNTMQRVTRSTRLPNKSKPAGTKPVKSCNCSKSMTR